jgi:alkanesulfonate monooxygenase SsuD/methylene tetrahydromethanopterin reductase-like flavin-dependent oxidoreductase (luciferase family)
MVDLIDDEVLDTFAIVGRVDTIASKVEARFGDLVDRATLFLPPTVGDEAARALLAGFG